MDQNLVLTLKSVDIYQPKHLVLSNVNLNIQSGEFVYLIGQTGSGKSSLLKVVYGDLPIGAGEGMVAGFDLKKLNERESPFCEENWALSFRIFTSLPTERSRRILNSSCVQPGGKTAS